MATVGERAGLVTAAGQVGTESEGSRDRGRKRAGMVVPRVFSTEGVSPFDQVEWDLRTAEIKDERGRVDLRADRLRDPARLEPARHQRRRQQVLLRRERQHARARRRSVRQLVDRVTRTIADWGRDDGYFATAEDAERFYDELTWLCLNQYGAFNSPVWFNVGLYPPLRHRRAGQQLALGRGDPRRSSRPRAPTSTRKARPASSRASPTTWKTSWGWPTARPCCSSSARAPAPTSRRSARSREKLSGGGKPSRPGQLHAGLRRRSPASSSRGGKTRRAAKMQTLKVWHPDILEFIECKTKEEKKAQALIERGLRGQLQRRSLQLDHVPERQPLGPRHRRLPAAPSRTTSDWTTRAVTTGRPMDTYQARDAAGQDRRGDLALRRPRRAVRRHDPALAHLPEHARRSTRRIRAASTCSSTTRPATWRRINLMKFRREDGTFDVERFRAACRIFITPRRSWSTTPATRPTGSRANSHQFRPLGLGYANLGSLIMAVGPAVRLGRGPGAGRRRSRRSCTARRT